MSFIPSEKVLVAQFAEKVIYQEEEPDAKAWIVKSNLKPELGFRIRARSDFLHHVEKACPDFLDEQMMGIPTKGSFCKGRPLRRLAVPIFTRSGQRRPRFLWRAVHAGQPFGGRKARGYGTVRASKFTFQRLLQLHMNWKARNSSPFLSVTKDWDNAAWKCAGYEARGYKGIQILRIDATVPEWNDEVLGARMWQPYEALRALDCTVSYNTEGDFVVKNEIPPSAIVHVFQWDKIKKGHRWKRIQARACVETLGQAVASVLRRLVNKACCVQGQGPPPRKPRAPHTKDFDVTIST